MVMILITPLIFQVLIHDLRSCQYLSALLQQSLSAWVSEFANGAHVTSGTKSIIDYGLYWVLKKHVGSRWLFQMEMEGIASNALESEGGFTKQQVNEILILSFHDLSSKFR